MSKKPKASKTTRQLKYGIKPTNVDYSRIAEIAPSILHDVGNAVGSIQANLELLGMSDLTDKNCWEMSLLGVQEIKLLLDNFRYYTYGVDLDQQMEVIPTELIIKSLCGLFSTQCKLLNINLKTQLVKVGLYGNKLQFKRIVLNLLTNAIEAVCKVKRERFITINSIINREFLILSVEDNGVGIIKRNQMKIFKNGFSTKKESCGSGQGLAIVRESVESFGGNVEVKSKLNVGTKFVVTIPLKQ